MSTAHDFIRFALAQDVLRFGEFKTKAGRLSPYFFNAGLFYDGASLAQLANGYAEVLIERMGQGFAFDALFGPAYKGITLASATAMAETYKREGRAMDDALEPIRYVTASLSVEYKNPTPIGVELVLYGKTNAVEGRKAFVDLVLRAEGILCATGQMVAVRLPEDVMNASGH